MAPAESLLNNILYPADHRAGMRVPKGGSSCANCKYLKDAEKRLCNNKYFILWNKGPVIPAPIDEYCSDWYEAASSEPENPTPSGSSDQRIVAYFVRHGETALNKEGRFRGGADVPLNDKGVAQARQAARFLSGITFGAAWSSDLLRAISTAEIVLDSLEIDAEQTRELRGIDVGEWQGEKKDDHREEMAYYQAHPDEAIPGGESINEFRARVRGGILKPILTGTQCDNPSFAAVHSSIIQELGNILYGDRKRLVVKPGGVVAVYFDGKKYTAKAILHPRPDASSVSSLMA